jgi:hypothetical protein
MKIIISQKEYYEKLLQVTAHVIPALIQKEPNTDLKKDVNRETFAFLSMSIAKAVLREIGYVPNTQSTGSKTNNSASIEESPIVDREENAIQAFQKPVLEVENTKEVEEEEDDGFTDHETGVFLKQAPFGKATKK